MNLEKQNNLFSVLITILLLTQVALSSGIIYKLNRIDQIQTYNLGSQPLQQNVPDYIEEVSLDDDPSLGTKEAPVTIVEFADYQCPFCAEAVANIQTVLSDNPEKVLFVYRDFPLELSHPDAFKAAEAANCAGDQGKYWEMHNLLFENQAQLDKNSLKKYAAQLQLNLNEFNDCMDSHKYANEIRHDMEDGKNYQVTGTPTFFVNGHRLAGPSLEQLQQRIDLVLEEVE